MTHTDDSDDDYATIVATSWGDQNAGYHVPNDNVCAWHTLADPDAKIGPGGLGSGNLHRKGRNYIPVNEDIIIKQRTKGQVSKEKMTHALKAAGSHTAPKHPVKPKKVPKKTAFTQKNPFVRPHPAKHEPSNHQMTTLRPPPKNNAWSQALSEEPFWEGQEKPKRSHQASKATTALQSRPEVPQEWEGETTSWNRQNASNYEAITPRNDVKPSYNHSEPSWDNSTSWNEAQSWDNVKPPWNDNKPSWNPDDSFRNNNKSSWEETKLSWDNNKPLKNHDNYSWSDSRATQNSDHSTWIKQKPAFRGKKPAHREKPFWKGKESTEKPPKWRSPSEKKTYGSGTWTGQHDIRDATPKRPQYLQDMDKDESTAPYPSVMDRPRALRPPPGLFKNALAQLGKDSNTFPLSKPPGLSPIPLNLRAQQREQHSKKTAPPGLPHNNPVVITINIEIESDKTVPVEVREHDDPEVLARSFIQEHEISNPEVTNALLDLFRIQKDLAIQKRSNQARTVSSA
ncbi:hypothetical protein EC973_001275 [Apophysomyces ossiformis]|uniref:Uncharacterized protein n=1 Tax=Apophysomyces ossiformis TaxID=679940 RepID=A0A8H7EPF1_9FUNG|nr:hypothetical protein EC973_001275 [Apophysomyces ossiformis]